MAEFVVIFSYLLSVHFTNGQRYLFINLARQWEVAEIYCQDIYGTNLASIHSQSQQDEATATCDDNVKCWIGLNDRDVEGIWKWSDGTAVDIEFWSDEKRLAFQDCANLNNNR